MKELIKYNLLILPLLFFSCNSDSKVNDKTGQPSTTKADVTACETIKCPNASDIDVENDNIYVLRNIKSKAGVISKLKYPEKKWQNLPGKDFKSFTVSSTGKVYGLKDTRTKKGVVHHLVDNKWQQLPGANFNSIDLDSSNSLYAITAQNNKQTIVKWNNSKWDKLHTSLNIRSIQVTNPNEIYVVKSKNEAVGSVYRLVDKKLEKMTQGGVKDFTIHNGQIAAIKSTKAKGDLAFILNNEGKWDNLSSRKIKSIDFDNKYNYSLAINKSGKTYIRKCLTKS